MDIDELIANVKLCEEKKAETTKVLNHFANKHKTFFSLRDKNLDPHNTIFLISYDLLSITYLWSDNLAKIGKDESRESRAVETFGAIGSVPVLCAYMAVCLFNDAHCGTVPGIKQCQGEKD